MSDPTDERWTPHQLELLRDSSRIWHLRRFRPTDAPTQTRGGAKIVCPPPREQRSADEDVVPERWEHDQCSLCGTTISNHPGWQSTAYTDGTAWVCVDCYCEYIEPRRQWGSASGTDVGKGPRFARGSTLRRLGEGLAWIAVVCVVGAFSIMFWGLLGAALLLIPIVGIGVMIRAIILELRGKRPQYTPGVAKLSGIPTKPKPFRLFQTRFPNDSDQD